MSAATRPRRTRATRPAGPRPPRKLTLKNATAGTAFLAIVCAGAWAYAATLPLPDGPENMPLSAAKGGFVSLVLAMGALLVGMQVGDPRIRGTLALVPGLGFLLALPTMVAAWGWSGPGFHPWVVLVPVAAMHAADAVALARSARGAA